MAPQAVLAGLGLGWARVPQVGCAPRPRGPRGANLTKSLVFWRTPVRQNITMLGPTTETYGVKWHSGVIRGDAQPAESSVVHLGPSVAGLGADFGTSIWPALEPSMVALGPTLNAPFGVSKWLGGQIWSGWHVISWIHVINARYNADSRCKCKL